MKNKQNYSVLGYLLCFGEKKYLFLKKFFFEMLTLKQHFRPVVKISDRPGKTSLITNSDCSGANFYFQRDVCCHVQENILQQGITSRKL